MIFSQNVHFEKQGQANIKMQVYSQSPYNSVREEVADIGGTATAPSPLGLLKQLLPAVPHKLVDHPPGGNVHVLHPLLVELAGTSSRKSSQ